MKNNFNSPDKASLQYKLLTWLVPSSYPLYIKSNNGCLSGLLSFDSPSAATANHTHAMDRSKRDLRLKAFGYRCGLEVKVKASEGKGRTTITVFP